MSGGFFRGTSADQDTRFSNKQAKLLKSQKFASELENLVDMTKVKLDVLRPWIAKRVTELIGFEDEVLINFIYGLLEGKGVNGKQVQIQLTGFMERNTGKFMKELWALLLSAEQNVSGVPQQFLDAKEEETKRKMLETDRIANEIQRKKENQEIEQEKKKMGGDGARPRDQHAELELNVKDDARGSSVKPAEEKEQYKKNGRRRHGRDSQSPDSSYHSPSLRERRRSRSISGAPPSRSRSISSEKQYRSSPKRSVTPQRRHISRRSPSPWRRSPHSKRRSPSHSRRRSPSPARYWVSSTRHHRSRSPLRHRSRSPVRCRSRSPVRRRSRSPLRRRSRSPVRRRSRSPLRRRSRSALRRRSRTPIKRSSLRYRSRTPLRKRSPSPVHRRTPSPKQGISLSPVRGRSPSPVRCRRSPSPVRRQGSPSPVRCRRSPARRRYQRSPSIPGQQSVSPVHRRMHGRKRSSTPVTLRSPQELSPPSDIRRSSLSPVIKGSAKSASSPILSCGERARRHGKYSPARRTSPKERIELPAKKGTRIVNRRPVVSLRSPQREMLSRDDSGEERELSPPLANASRGKSYSEERSPHTRERMAHPGNSNPLCKSTRNKPHRESSGTSADDEENLSSREIGEYNNRSMRKNSPTSRAHKDSFNSSEVHGLIHGTKSQKTQLPSSDLIPDRMHHKEHRERQELATTSKVSDLTVKGMDSYDDGARAKDKKIARAYETRGGYRLSEMESIPELSSKSEQNGSVDSPTKETDEHRGKVKEKRKHKKSHRQEVESDDYSSYDSHEERKEAKRRKKEGKKVKKERRRRRDVRRHKRDGSHAEKHSEDESVRRKESQASQTQETESEQKRLEIELREKALESLRAKKGIGN